MRWKPSAGLIPERVPALVRLQLPSIHGKVARDGYRLRIANPNYAGSSPALPFLKIHIGEYKMAGELS